MHPSSLALGVGWTPPAGTPLSNWWVPFVGQPSLQTPTPSLEPSRAKGTAPPFAREETEGPAHCPRLHTSHRLAVTARPSPQALGHRVQASYRPGWAGLLKRPSDF